jgi:hypothetical protein
MEPIQPIVALWKKGMNLIYLRQYGAEPYFSEIDRKDTTRCCPLLADAVCATQKAREEWQGGPGFARVLVAHAAALA